MREDASTQVMIDFVTDKMGVAVNPTWGVLANTIVDLTAHSERIQGRARPHEIGRLCCEFLERYVPFLGMNRKKAPYLSKLLFQ